MKKLVLVLLVFVFTVGTVAGCNSNSIESDFDKTQTYDYYDDIENDSDLICNHTYAEATCEEAKKCTLCGETSGSALGHSYSNATCTEAKQCTRCGKTSGSALGHKWVNATCQTPKKCTRCGVTEGNKTDHDMNTKGICSSCGKDVFAEFVKENLSIQLIIPSVGASDNYYCEVKFINHTGYTITLNSHVYANGKGCVNLEAGDYTLETDYSVKVSFYRSIVPENRWDKKYQDMYLDNNSTATTSIEINGRYANIRFGINGTIDVEYTY